MEWTPIHPVNIEDFFGGETKAKAEAINTRIVALLAGRATLDSDRQAFSENASELGGKALKQKATLEARELDLFKEEIEIREEMLAFDRMRSTDASSAASEAYSVFEKAQADIRKKLVKIGYADVDPYTPAVGKITPDMVNKHPDVLGAKRRSEALMTAANNHDGRNANKAALERVREAVAMACR